MKSLTSHWWFRRVKNIFFTTIWKQVHVQTEKNPTNHNELKSNVFNRFDSLNVTKMIDSIELVRYWFLYKTAPICFVCQLGLFPTVGHRSDKATQSVYTRETQMTIADPG